MLVVVRTEKSELQIIKLKVTRRADDIVEAFALRHDMKKQGVVSRIYERFGGLPEAVQKWFIGLTDGNEGEGMRLFAEALQEKRAVDDLATPAPESSAEVTVGRVNQGLTEVRKTRAGSGPKAPSPRRHSTAPVDR